MDATAIKNLDDKNLCPNRFSDLSFEWRALQDIIENNL
jgi:RNA polymerase subunit RPABC4/transcription elongation factor Spt4